jgi:hypothetical protein
MHRGASIFCAAVQRARYSKTAHNPGMKRDQLNRSYAFTCSKNVIGMALDVACIEDHTLSCGAVSFGISDETDPGRGAAKPFI